MTDPFSEQVGGEHYKEFEIQPAEFLQKNKIPFMEACIIKYAIRHRQKGGAQDIKKIIQYAQMILATEYRE